MINLRRKDESVNLDLHPAFDEALPVLETAYRMCASLCIVTSGKDGGGKEKVGMVWH